VLDVDGGGRALDALRPADIDPLIVSSKIKTGALPAPTMEPEMADAETRLVALEEAFYVLVRALEEKKILEPGPSQNGYTRWKKHFAIQERRHWRMRFRKCAGILTEVMQADARKRN
jgi:hypothetical protein